MTAQDLRWDPPGPGEWRSESAHCYGSMTPIGRHLMAEGIEHGMRRLFADFGMPADTLQPAFVNGHLYLRLRPLIGADRASASLPPKAVLWLAMRLHPELRRRERRAAHTLRTQPWRDAVRRWDTETRPAVERANLAFQDVELAALDDAALADHFDAVLAHAVEHWRLHFVLHGFDLGPIGLLLVACREWGVDPAVVVPALAGASPATSEPARALARLRALVEASGRTPGSLDEVRELSAEAGEELDRYLRFRGLHVFSRYDVDGICLQDAPEVVLASIRDGNGVRESVDARAAAEAARAAVPERERRRFDELLAEARLAMNLRDDNGPVTAEWTLGLVRRVLVEVGRRLVARGTIADGALALELAPPEVGSLLRSGTGPDGAALEARAAHRRLESAAVAPDVLGAPEPEPPLSVAPAAMATMIATVRTVTELLARKTATRPLDGVGVGVAPYRGRVRRASTPEDAIASLEPGEVLVVRFTTPAYNVVLPLAGAIVTTEGGALSHAAVLARELGVPAVIGAAGALDLLHDGDEVEVDPVAGTVHLAGAGAPVVHAG